MPDKPGIGAASISLELVNDAKGSQGRGCRSDIAAVADFVAVVIQTYAPRRREIVLASDTPGCIGATDIAVASH